MLVLTHEAPAADLTGLPRGLEESTRGLLPPHPTSYNAEREAGKYPPVLTRRIRLAIRIEPGPWADHCHAERPRSYVISSYPWHQVALAYASLAVVGLYLAAMAVR